MNSTMIEIRSALGLRVRAQRWGSEPATLVLIHGLGEGSFVWEHLIDALSAYGSTIAIDLPGHGDSAHDPAGRYGGAIFAADLERVMDLVAARDVTLIGHSLGAQVAMRVALDGRYAIKGLVIVDGGLGWNQSASAVMQERFSAQARRFHEVAEYCQALMEKYPLAQPSLLQHIASRSLRQTQDGMLELKCDPAVGKLFGVMEDPALWLRLHTLDCPTLIVRGSGSSVFPRAVAEQMATAIPGALLHVVPRAGHAVMIDAPEAFLGLLEPFLSRLPARRNTSDARGTYMAR